MNEGNIPGVFDRARKAAHEISKEGIEERILLMGNLRRVVLREQDRILDQVQKETGKSRLDGYVAEIFSVLDGIHFLEKQSRKILSDEKVHTPIALMGKTSYIYYEPMGVVLVISPWNYPFYMGLIPSLFAFAAGNAVIYKPSEWTPLEGLMEYLFHEAGFPREWIQVVYGDGKVGNQLVESGPDKIFFTGSVPTGRLVAEKAAKKLIPVELELGGKDPMLVFGDANIQRAVGGAMWGAFTTSGQSCTSVERCYVQRSIYEEFREKLVQATNEITMGQDTDGSRDLGRMTTEFQVATVKKHLDQALAQGATQWTGKKWDGLDSQVPPIVLDNVPVDCDVLTQETFGPLLPLIPFDSEEEAVTLANQSRYGLSASVWTGDKKRGKRVARALQVGNVSINNVMLTEGNPALPFGGTKESGIGRYKGAWGLRSFTHMKSVIYDSDSAKIEANWFPYTEKKYELFKKTAQGLFGDGLVSGLNFLRYALQLERYSAKIGKRGRSSCGNTRD